MRSSRMFWGIVLAAVGTILLLQNLGIVSASFWPIFWALLIILAGVWILLGPVLSKRDAEIQPLSIPLEGTNEAEIVLKHGAGRIHLNALQTPGELLSGSFSGGVEKKYTPGAFARLELTPPVDGVWAFPFIGSRSGYIWNIGLNRDIPIRLKIEAGAGEAVLDLSDLLIKDLRIDTGASSTDVTLPSRAGSTQATIKAGAASVKVRVPQGVAAIIHMDTGLTGIQVDTARFPNTGGSNYRSADYDSAQNRVDIRVEAGVGSIEII